METTTARRPRWRTAGLALATVSLLATTQGCSKARTAKDSGKSATAAKAGVAAAEKAGEQAPNAAKAATKALADKGAKSKPAALPKAATVATAKPKHPTRPPEKYSVVPHFARGKSTSFELPLAGKPARIRLTPIVGEGRPVTDLLPLHGGRFVAFFVRSDGMWAKRVVAPKVTAGGVTVPMRFPKGGAHVVWSVFQPPGRPIQAVQTYFNVDGKEAPAPDSDPEDGRNFRAKRLEVGLSAPSNVGVCDAIPIASIWSRGGGSAKLVAAADTGATVGYIAVNSGGSKVIVAKAIKSPAAGKAEAVGDPGSHAKLTLTEPGRWYVWAFAQVGKKPLQARFHLDAKGDVPEGGCVAALLGEAAK